MITSPLGFRAAGVAAGIKESGSPDVAVVINDGPSAAAAGVFTANRVKAAPVLWSQQVLAGGNVRAVVLNSGGANACTGPAGFQDTHRTAEHLAALLGIGAGEVAVCSTGLIGDRLPLAKLLAGVTAATGQASADGGLAAADAIRTTDTVPKTTHQARFRIPDRRDGKGRGDARARPGHHARRADHGRRPAAGRARHARCARRSAPPSTGSTPTAACPRTTRCCCWPAARAGINAGPGRVHRAADRGLR